MRSADILVVAPLLPIVTQTLDPCLIVHDLAQQVDQAAFLKEIGPNIRGAAASTLAGRVDSALLSRLPNLEIVSSFGVGYEHVDMKAAAARGIVVTNTPGVLDDEVADLAVGLLIATLRQIPQADRHVRERRWEQCAFPLSPTLRNRSIGIVGLGNIGKAIARRLEGFGVTLAYHGRRVQSGVRHAYYPTLTGLAEAVDTLIIVVPGGAGTKHMIGEEVLEALGPQGIVINVSRGSVIDEEALVRALQRGTIMGAGLDVYENEPFVPQSLIEMPNVVLLPHVGSASAHTWNAMGKLVADNLNSWFGTGRPLTPVPESVATLHDQSRLH